MVEPRAEIGASPATTFTEGKTEVEMYDLKDIAKDVIVIGFTYIICVAGGVFVLYELLKPFGFFN